MLVIPSIPDRFGKFGPRACPADDGLAHQRAAAIE
jgi:hypothetical protein